MRTYVQSQTAKLLRRLAGEVERTGQDTDPDHIHDLRVAIRRLNRCLRVFSQFYPGGAWKPVRKQLSALMQMAGAVRDCDIALELIRKAGVTKRAAVMKSFEDRREKAARKLKSELSRWAGRNLPEKWREPLDV
jgi:CHAD domain-containing protein